MEAVRIIKEMRNATKQLSMHGADDDIRVFPRIAIWENVPGAFSSNGGEDFRCVLEELARIENPEVSIPKPKKWGVQDGLTYLMDVSHGAHMTLSIGESPNEERESRLSQILEEHPHQKYSLSPRACQGILNRAERRGKELPLVLKEALMRQATPSRLGGALT